MGCGPSHDENPNEIKSQMKWTKVPELDDFFKSASEFLEGLEDLRATFQDTIEEMHEIGRTEELQDPKLIEAFRLFFWSCSANKKGNIIDCDLKFNLDPPSFTVDCSYMDWKTWDFSDAFKKLIGGITGAPAKIIDLTKLSAEIGEKALEVSKNFKEKIESSSLNALDKGRAVANSGVNIKRITDNVQKAPNVFKQAQQALEELKEVIPKIPELIAQADEVGKKAYEKNLWRMWDIFDHFQTAPKKNAEKIKEEKKKKKGKWQRKSKHAPGKGAKDAKDAKGDKGAKAGDHGKPAEQGKPVEQGKPAEQGKPVENDKPAENDKPVEVKN